MTRLEGKKPNVGAIVIGAIIFSLVAAGLFFAFWPVPDPTDAGLSNSADTSQSSSDANSTADTNATGDESANSLATILTPLPLATAAATPGSTTPDSAQTANSVDAPVAASTDAPVTDSAPAENSVAAPMAAATAKPETNLVPTPISP